MNTKKIIKTVLNNYFLAIFIAIAFFAILIASFKLLTSKPTYIYVKVKLGQGLWWANTAKPNLWFLKAINKGEVEYDLLGRPIAEILNVRSYPTGWGDQRNIFITVKLAVDKNKKFSKYTFKRTSIAVGSPIDLEFPSSQITGTIIDMNEKGIEEKFIEKIVYFTKKYSFPWEYDAIKIGDQYFDGQSVVFEILDKKSTDTNILFPDVYGNFDSSTSDPRKYIQVKAKMKLQERSKELFFGEEQIIKTGSIPFIITSNFIFENFYIASIE